MISAMCSMPVDTRIKSSVTPAPFFSSSDSCWCVVVHGWICVSLARGLV